ncbi:hypothetical protein J6590_050310 [Homalodisca vitripennis]|nr:hypothetical protein J6590_050310 [Homalodisca vitripennis]
MDEAESLDNNETSILILPVINGSQLTLDHDLGTKSDLNFMNSFINSALLISVLYSK